MLSHALLSSPPLELVEGSCRKDDRGGGKAAGEVGSLGLVIPDVTIAECMATLQATPTDVDIPKNSVPLSLVLCDDGGGCGADDSGVEDVWKEEEKQSGGCGRGGVTTRIGDLYQAAISDLADCAGVVDSLLARALPLRLCSPGIAPERAQDLASPRPWREGYGSRAEDALRVSLCEGERT